jgi:GTPase SAR1 family protein
MPLEFNTQSRIVILGRTRCGKTYLSTQIQKMFPRVVIIDTVQDYRPDGKSYFFSDFETFGHWLVKAQYASEFRAVYQFSIHDVNKFEIANEIFKILFSVGNVLLVVDEVQYYKASHYLSEIILVGARHGIATITSTQRPANISKDLISQSSDIFIGKLFETNDSKYLGDFLSNEDLLKISSLEPRKFLHFRPGESTEIISNDLT